MRFAILGAGGIGSTFAVQLARARHDVTIAARNRRLDQLRRDGGVRTQRGVVAVSVADALPEDVAYDLVLVTVLAHQLEPVLPALVASSARTVMFMFNTFASLAPLREALGDRFAFGFPSMLAQVDADGVLATSIQDKGLLTTVTDASWARVFTDAGIKTTTTPDMESWLRSHAAAIAPFMIAASEAHRAGRGISWAHARLLAAAQNEAFALVGELGHPIIPAAHALIGRLPAPAMTAVLWAASRTAAVRASGAAGDAEPRALIDAMRAASPHDLPSLMRARP